MTEAYASSCGDLIDLSPVKPAQEPEVIDVQAQRSGRKFSIRRQQRNPLEGELPLVMESTKSNSCTRFQISRVSKQNSDSIFSDGDRTISVEVSVSSTESPEGDPLIDACLA